MNFMAFKIAKLCESICIFLLSCLLFIQWIYWIDSGLEAGQYIGLFALFLLLGSFEIYFIFFVCLGLSITAIIYIILHKYDDTNCKGYFISFTAKAVYLLCSIIDFTKCIFEDDQTKTIIVALVGIFLLVMMITDIILMIAKLKLARLQYRTIKDQKEE